MNTTPGNTVPRKTAREARRPFGSTTQKLAYPARPGFHRHWFKDSIPGRIEAALAAGYTHVEDREGRKVQVVSGVASGGGPETSFLMEIPQEWYEEDMAAQQAKVDETDAAIRRGAVAGTPGEDGRYVKGINIRDGRSS